MRPLPGQGDDEDEVLEKLGPRGLSSSGEPSAARLPSSRWRLSSSDASFIKMAPVLGLGLKPWLWGFTLSASRVSVCPPSFLSKPWGRDGLVENRWTFAGHTKSSHG